MAITINSQPTNYSSMHEPLYFVVSSDNTTETNFKYVCDIYINGNLVSRLKSFPQPSNSKGIFNVSNIVRNYWQSYFKPTGVPTAFTYITSDIYVTYEVKFGEEYGGTTYLNLEETESTAYNFYPDFFAKDILSPFRSEIPYGQFITNRDKTYLQYDSTSLTNKRMFVPYLASEANVDLDFHLNVFVRNGATLVSYNGSSITERDFVLLDVSPLAINTYLGTSAITSATTFYDVEMVDDDVERDSVRVYLDCQPRSESLNLHFLNALGGYDTMNFAMVNRENRAGQKKSFSALEYEFASATNAMTRYDSNNVFYGGTKNFWGEQTISFALKSNWIREKDYRWLKELIYSPEVYLEWNGYYLPVNVTDSAWNEKKNYQDKQFNLELNVELASKVNSQFR